MSQSLDEKVRRPSDDEKTENEFHDPSRGYGGLADDPDAGLSAEERADIVGVVDIACFGCILTFSLRTGNFCAN